MRKQSALGLASAALALLTGGYVAIFHGLSLTAMLINHPYRVLQLVKDTSVPDYFVPVIGLGLLGFGLGIAGIIKPRRHRLLPCLGMLINFLVVCDIAYQWANPG